MAFDEFFAQFTILRKKVKPAALANILVFFLRAFCQRLIPGEKNRLSFDSLSLQEFIFGGRLRQFLRTFCRRDQTIAIVSTLATRIQARYEFTKPASCNNVGRAFGATVGENPSLPSKVFYQSPTHAYLANVLNMNIPRTLLSSFAVILLPSHRPLGIAYPRVLGKRPVCCARLGRTAH